MREIEFRGKALISIEELDEIGIKHINGYVYGDLVDNSHIVTGILESNDEYICIETWCGIDQKTIGQYTERQDINNNKIFEKDIATCQFFDKKITGLIEFIEFMWAVNDRKNQRLYQFNEVSNIEIIGNIHENSEILEEQ